MAFKWSLGLGGASLGKKERLLWDNLSEVKLFCSGNRNKPIREKTNDIADAVISPLKSAFFHYMVSVRQDAFPEFFSITRLLPKEAPQNDFALLCGTALEGLLRIAWKSTTLEKKVPDTGDLINRYHNTELEKDMKIIWRKRIRSKAQDIDLDRTELFRVTCQTLLGLLGDMAQNHIAFNARSQVSNRSVYTEPVYKYEGGYLARRSETKSIKKQEREKYSAFSKEQLDRLADIKNNLDKKR